MESTLNIIAGISIGTARRLLEINKRIRIPETLKNIILFHWSYKDLYFNPIAGDILSSKNSLVMFESFVDGNAKDEENGRAMISIYSYIKDEDIIIRSNIDNDNKGALSICGYENDFVFASEDEKKLFYKKLSEYHEKE